jgi:hypothetical protein
METDGISSECNRAGVPVQNQGEQDRGLAMDTDTLPDVLLGSEAWHTTLPSVSFSLHFDTNPFSHTVTIFRVSLAFQHMCHCKTK